MEAVVAPDGAVAILLPVYQSRSWRAILDRLTMRRDAAGALVDDPNKRSALSRVAAVVPLRFVVLGTIHAEETHAVSGVERWAKDLRLPVKTRQLPRWLVAGFPTEHHSHPKKATRKTPDAGPERQGQKWPPRRA